MAANMKRRSFCKSLALVPVVAVVGLGAARSGVRIRTGNVKLQFPKLYPHQRDALRLMEFYHGGTDMRVGFINSCEWRVGEAK